MKKLILLLTFFVFGSTLFAQAPAYDKYSVTVSAGSDLLRKPFTPKLDLGLGFGYKFAANYKKPFDTVYGNVGYTGWQQVNATSYHVGLQKTMMNDRDRLGLLAKVEGGATTLYGHGRNASTVTKPSGAAGVGVAFDFSGDPYPKFMNHITLSLVPMLNKIESRPVYWTLALGFTKSFK